jgi:acyl-CoA synthetase (NDP forming)
MKPPSLPSLRLALDPKSIAIVGASENPNKIGGRPLLYLRRFGFKGSVYPINPNRREAQGYKAYPRLADLPEAPELAIIAVPGDAALAALDECAERGAKIAILMASGFGESDPVGGKATERRMTERAHARGMRLIGPNCQGLANFGTGAIANFSTMFLEAEPMDGPIGIVSQSGAMSVVPYGHLRAAGLGVRHVHATGNDCDVTVAELAAEVAEDPALRLLLLYLESMPDPHHLAEMARRARARDLPVIALKAGRTAAGQAAARSHTGALANEDRVVDAFFERHGIWRAPDTASLVDAAALYLKGWRPEGRRFVAVSNSGATCVMSADAATAAGLEIARLRDETRADLGRILPSFATTTNPIDLTAALLTNSGLLGEVMPVLARDDAADLYMIGVPVAGAGYDVDAFARDAAEFARTTEKPLVIVAPQPSVAARFTAQGLPIFVHETQAIGALAQLVGHRDLIARTSRLRAGDPPPARYVPAAAGAARMLDEAESLALVAASGVPVVAHRLCRSADEAAAALRALGGPVAVKGCSREVAHKSELGIVRLGLRDEAGIRAAFEAIAATLKGRGLASSGVIVAAMAPGRREMMIGAHRDPVFGPVVALGDGGKYVEALPDLRLLLPPFAKEEVLAALRRLRIAPLLSGARGEPPLDLDAFAEAALSVARLMTERPEIASLDLNPVLLGAEGQGCVAVDALAFVASAEA